MISMTTSPEGEAGGNIIELAVELAREVAALPSRRLQPAIALVRELAALPPEEAARTLVAASERSDAEGVIAAKTLILVRELAALPPEEAARTLVAASERSDAEGVIAAKTLVGITTSSNPLEEVVAKTIYLIRDLAFLPTWIAGTAVVLAGEAAFTAAEALAAFEALAARGCAISGVELWQQDGNMPMWLATSDYDTQRCRGIDNWAEYVSCCLSWARTFVMQFSDVGDALFNYSWWEEAEQEIS